MPQTEPENKEALAGKESVAAAKEEELGSTAPKRCLACGAVETSAKKLLRCSGCLSVNFCDAECQKASWKDHKGQCTRCKKVDVYASSPLLAALTFLPRMNLTPKMLTYEVARRELHGRELHLHLRNQGRMRVSPAEFDLSGRVREGPSREQLHHMVQLDGYVEASVVGSLYGFYCAVQMYNNRGTAAAAAGRGPQPPPPPSDYVTLVHRTGKITEYGIAMGSTCPDYTLVYHVGDKVRQLQDPKNHVWMYFRTERADRLYLDVGSLPYGMGLMMSILDYLPDGTPESQIRQLIPRLGAPGCAFDRSDLALMDRIRPNSSAALRTGYLADRERFPVTGLSTEVDPEVNIRGLLQRLREAATEAAEAEAEAAAVEKGAAGTETLVGMVAAAAVVTAAAVAAAPSGGGGGGGGSPSRLQSGGGSAAGGKKGGIGGGGAAASSSAPSSAGRRRCHVPFLHGPLDKHVTRAMLHFECAFHNTTAVLEQGTYKRYPPSPDPARCFAPWVDVGALNREAATHAANRG